MRGLFAAGDAAGGAPQKYVTGALAEGEIAAESIAAQLRDKKQTETMPPQEDYLDEPLALKEIQKMQEHLDQPAGILDWKQLEEAMQKVMDEYAGGIRTDYRYNESRLQKADEEIQKLQKLTDQLPAEDMFDLLHVYEVRERLIVCRTLIAHMRARKETRWHTFGENADYPEQSEEGLRYVNSRMRNGKIEILFRDLVKGGRYEHTDR